jgi:hypothetical protein
MSKSAQAARAAARAARRATADAEAKAARLTTQSARQFIFDRCIASTHGACSVLPEPLFQSYSAWAKKKGVPAYASKGQLVGAMIDLGLMSTTIWLKPHGFDLPRVNSTVPEMVPE